MVSKAESRIRCHKEVVGDFYERCFNDMEGTGLELFIQVIVG